MEENFTSNSISLKIFGEFFQKNGGGGGRKEPQLVPAAAVVAMGILDWVLSKGDFYYWCIMSEYMHGFCLYKPCSF